MSIFYQSRTENCHSFISYNNSYPAHLHKQLELVLVLDGCIDIMIEQQTYTLHAGDISLTFPNLIHASSTTDTSKVLFVLFDASFLSDYTYEFTKFRPACPVLNKDSLCLTARQSLVFLTEAATLNTDTALEDIPEKNRRSMLKGMLLIVLSDILSHMQLNFSDRLNSDISQKILTHIDQHITEELSLGTVARALGLNKYYLSHIFSNRLKLSFTEYIASKRLELACQLLKDSALPITDIAYEAGFTSTRSFYRHFRASHGCSPAEYRKKQT